MFNYVPEKFKDFEKGANFFYKYFEKVKTFYFVIFKKE